MEKWNVYINYVNEMDVELIQYNRATLWERKERQAYAFRTGILTLGKKGDGDTESCNAIVTGQCDPSTPPAKQTWFYLLTTEK